MNTYCNETNEIGTIVLQYVADIQDNLFARRFQDYKRITIPHKSIRRPTKSNPYYKFDLDSHKILLKHLETNKLNCNLFSEETGKWILIGDNPKYFVVCDPFCNSWLATKGFYESSVAICITDSNGELVACAIGDLQFKRIFYADQTGAYVWYVGSDGFWQRSQISVSETTDISEAFLVTSLLKQKRRQHASSSNGYFTILRKSKFLYTMDGAIMIGRLAAGEIDGYMDPFQGQPLYELPCCEIILKAGGVVSNIEGKKFSLPDMITDLQKSPKSRYKIVAASTQKLHKLLLDVLKKDN